MDYIDSKLSGVYSANELANEIAELESTKQDKLVSGTNIKTVNDNSLVGSGNVSLKESKLTAQLVATVSVGGIPSGTIFPVDTSIENILRELFATNTNNVLYYGASNNIPSTAEKSFTQADIPDDFITNGFTCHYNTVEEGREGGKYPVFMYPKKDAYGYLHKIFYNPEQEATKFNLIDNWTVKDVTVNGYAFYMYYQNKPIVDADATYQFLFN